MRRAWAAGAVVMGLAAAAQDAGIAWIPAAPLPDGGVADAGPPPDPNIAVPPSPAMMPGRVIREKLRAGRHWRLETEYGAVHVFRPRGYDPASAGTLVYVHGYYNFVDEVWEQHRLLEQFAAARQNALYVVPEACYSNPDPVKWPDLNQLLDRVARLTRERIPDGQVVVVGHSGAFRTIIPWLISARPDEVILLDGLYRSEAEFISWMSSSPGHVNHRLILVGFETADRTEVFLKKVRGAVLLDGVPVDVRDLKPAQRYARVLYMRSPVGHMEMITDGKILPVVLRLTPFRRL